MLLYNNLVRHSKYHLAEHGNIKYVQFGTAV